MTQQVVSMSVGVMVRVYGSPAVMVISPVFVIVLPMATASIVATPTCVPEVAMAVAVPPVVSTSAGGTEAMAVGLMVKPTLTPSGVGLPKPSFTSAVRAEVFPPSLISSGSAVTVRV